MKKYNIKNYVRYKEDVKVSIASIKNKRFVDYTSRELKVIFLTLIENKTNILLNPTLGHKLNLIDIRIPADCDLVIDDILIDNIHPYMDDEILHFSGSFTTDEGNLYGEDAINLTTYDIKVKL